MIYAMSDLHGQYDKYRQMLEKISFCDDDILYILGDVIDRGEGCVDILKDMSMRHNVYPIIGNHELMALDILKELMVEITEENYSSHISTESLKKLLEWQRNGGSETLSAFRRLPADERFELIEYMEEFVPFETVDVNGRSFILVHSGLGNFSPDKPLWEYTLEELTFMRPEYDKLFADDSVYIVCGHIPTLAITGKPEIYHCNNNICIDCAAAFGGRLACLRLDDMKEFYV